MCYKLVTAASKKFLFYIYAQAIILESNVMSPTLSGEKKAIFTNKFEQLTCVCAGAEGPETKRAKYLIKVVTSHISKCVMN